MFNHALRNSDDDPDELHNRSQTVSPEKEIRPSSFIPLKAFPEIHAYPKSNPELDRQISDAYTEMRNRTRVVNAAILTGTAALLVASYSAINFFIVMFASPEFIAKIRYLKFGMSVSGSACMFFNAACIFVLCVEMKYAIEHYVKRK
jgi:hypothetical protein